MECKGFVCALCVSLSCAPLALYFLSERGMSNVLHMYAAWYSLILTCFMVCMVILPPDVDFWNFERRGIFYYLCCILACVNVIQLAVHFRRLTLKRPTRFFATDDIYLKTSVGTCSVIWNNAFSYIIYLTMIFKIDNYSSIRNIALYWSGAMLTSELVTGIALFSGQLSKRVKYSSSADAIYVIIWAIVLAYFLILHPRVIRQKAVLKTCLLDCVITILLLFSIGFNFVRCMGALNYPLHLAKLYKTLCEPFMIHPSKHAWVWILLSGAFGIPCDFIAIYYLQRNEYEKAMNVALLHAGSALQGTSVYLAYNLHSRFYKLRSSMLWCRSTVYTCNALIVISAHLFVVRCFSCSPTLCTTSHNCVHVGKKKRFASDRSSIKEFSKA